MDLSSRLHNGSVRVLVVEDEVPLAESIARGLRSQGFDVDLSHDGADGLWRAREGTYSAIVLDILLPGRNGYEVCRALRHDGDATPILMLTAKDGEWDEAEAFDLGVDDYLTKPFSFVVLVARLRALARRAGSARPAPLRAGDLVLDTARRECRRGETRIELTPREYAVLELLLRREGTVVYRTDLLHEVWGFDFDGDPNVLEVYVGYLRRKIDKPFGTASLQTVRGAGYRLVDPAAADPADVGG